MPQKLYSKDLSVSSCTRVWRDLLTQTPAPLIFALVKTCAPTEAILKLEWDTDLLVATAILHQIPTVLGWTDDVSTFLSMSHVLEEQINESSVRREATHPCNHAISGMLIVMLMCVSSGLHFCVICTCFSSCERSLYGVGCTYPWGCVCAGLP